jgi:hypothetical protein
MDELTARVGTNNDLIRFLFWWMAVLSFLVFVLAVGKGYTLYAMWREHADVAELLRIIRHQAEISDMRRQDSRDKLKAEIGETVKCSVMEAAAVLPLPPPSDPGTLPTVTVPEGGMVVKPEGHP